MNAPGLDSIHDAATVLIYRLKPEPEFFMLKRSSRSNFMADAMVFPGGRVDPNDRDPSWRNREVLTTAEAPDDSYQVHQIAAIRESFEEAGVLFALRDGNAIDPKSSLGLQIFGPERDNLNRGDPDFLDCIRRHGLTLQLKALKPFTRWITPKGESRRFDARFFTAELPAMQVPLHDDHETTSGQWLSPRAALTLYARKEIVLAPPTLRILTELTLDWEAIHSPGIGWTRPMAPQALERDGVLHLLLPGDHEYVPRGDSINRISRIDGHWVSEGQGF